MPSTTARIDEGGAQLAGLSDVLGVATPPPPPPTAVATSGGGGGQAPVVSSTPHPGQGISLDAAGKLPLAIQQLQVGFAFSYTELQSSATITATTEATAHIVLTSSGIKLDGSTAVCVEFFDYRVDMGATWIAGSLFDAVGTGSAASLGSIFQSFSAGLPVLTRRFFTPAAGVHTFSVRAFVDAGSGKMWANAGGAAVGMPAYLRITRA